MNILIIEDDNEKYASIKGVVDTEYDQRSVSHVRASTLAEAVKQIYAARYDIILVDLMLPNRPNDPPTDASDELIEAISQGTNSRTNVLALTGYTELADERISNFNEAGITLITYDHDEDKWQEAIRAALVRIKASLEYDFLVFCALEIERSAFGKSEMELGNLKQIDGLDCRLVTINNLKGLCIKSPKMGMIDASITVARSIERFQPKLVAMSGICAGVGKQGEIGTTIIASSCWDYQSGKLGSAGLQFEPNTSNLHPDTEVTISQLIADGVVGPELGADLEFPVSSDMPVLLTPMVSGSAVLANGEKIQDLQQQNRKIAAVDMEMAAFYRASELSPVKPVYFGAKTIVDNGDEKKSDDYQIEGSIYSARIISTLITQLFEQIHASS